MTGYIGRKMKTLFISEKAPHWRTNLRTGKIDCRKLHRLSRGSLEVCKQKGEHTYEDSAVWLVIDNSGSMKGVKASIAYAILACMASDLDKLRIPFGAVGFTSYQEPVNDEVRRSPCRLTLMKDFSEPYRVIRHRFVEPKSSSLTAEFPAIKFGAQKLAMRRESKRILFILTDGSTETGSAELDIAMRAAMKEYVQRLIKAGMKVVGVGILDDSLEEYIPDFIHVDDLSVFANQFYTKLSQLIL
jgi:cobalamin biosynthesis protein CobT